MLQTNLTCTSRLLVVLTGMIKVGYCLMALSTYYFSIIDTPTQSYSSNYYKNVAAFAGGMVLNLFLYKNYSRFILILLNESLFSILMVIIPLTNSDSRVYGYLIGGGISIILYPVYAREHFLKDKLIMLFASLWFFLGLGVIYFYLVQAQGFSFFLKPLIQRDDITPYVFGSISILNIILLSIQKQKETLFYYSIKQENECLNQLVSQLYLPYHQQNILVGFSFNGNQEYNLPLLENQSVNSYESVSNNENKKAVILLYILAFFAGCSNVFFTVLQTLTQFLFLVNNNQNDFYFSLDMSQYYLYLLVVIPTTLIGSACLIQKNRRIQAITNFAITFIFNVILIILIENVNSSDTLQNYVSLMQVIFLFGGVAPMIFTLPFFHLKPHKIFIYFLCLWIGSVANKIFINNAYSFDPYINKNYNTLILATIASFFGSVAMGKVKIF